MRDRRLASASMSSTLIWRLLMMAQ
jgi:hypothetical protein